jgi:hypothetical protein
LIWISQLPTTSGVASLVAARTLALAISLLILFLVYRISKRLFSRPSFVLFAVILLLANPSYFNQGFRIRPDLLGSLLTLLLIAGSSFLLIPVAALATPKAIFQLLPVAIARYQELLSPQRRRVWLCGLGFLALFVAVNFPNLRFLSESTQSQDSLPYFSPEAFAYLWRLIVRYPILPILVLLRSVTIYYRFKKSAFRDPKEKQIQFTIALAAAFAIVTLTLYPARFPFFIASYLPLLSLYGALLLDDLTLLTKTFTEHRLDSAVLGLTFYCAMVGIAFGFENDRSNSNSEQLRAVQSVESFLDRHPSFQHYDDIGIVPKKTSFRAFVGPGQDHWNQVTLERLILNPPEVIFYVWKMKHMEPGLSQLLKSKYTETDRGVHVRNDVYQAAPSATYRLEPPLERPLQDIFSFDSAF